MCRRFVPLRRPPAKLHVDEGVASPRRRRNRQMFRNIFDPRRSRFSVRVFESESDLKTVDLQRRLHQGRRRNRLSQHGPLLDGRRIQTFVHVSSTCSISNSNFFCVYAQTVHIKCLPQKLYKFNFVFKLESSYY